MGSLKGIPDAIISAIQSKHTFESAHLSLKRQLLTELGTVFPKVGWTEIPTIDIDTRMSMVTFSYIVVWENGKTFDASKETDQRLTEFFHNNYPSMNVIIADRYMGDYRETGLVVAQTIRIYKEPLI